MEIAIDAINRSIEKSGIMIILGFHGGDIMQHVERVEVGRRIGYLQHMLSEVEEDMLRMKGKRLDMKDRLVYLHRLQSQDMAA